MREHAHNFDAASLEMLAALFRVVYKCALYVSAMYQIVNGTMFKYSTKVYGD